MERDDDDDPQLKSLRAVWLDMRDEDPPERGLAELMAAARTKASELREPEPSASELSASELREPEPRPSWWHRLARILRKPPMLALATAVVLLGAVVLIGARGDQMLAEAPALAESEGNDRSVSPGSPEGSAARGVAVDTTLGSPAGSTAHAEAEANTASEQPRRIEDQRESRRADGRPVDPTAAAEPSDSRAVPGPRSRPARRAAAPPSEHATVRPSEKLDDAVTSSLDHVHAFESAPSASGTAAPGTRTAQLLAEAKAAATRGDCARAQAWLKRLAAADEAAYRKALGSDASLRKCLAE